MSKWYIDKIKANAPDLLDGDKYDVWDWIDNAFAMYAEDEDAAAAMDDAIREQEEYYGTELDNMSRAQLLATAAKIMDVLEGAKC